MSSSQTARLYLLVAAVLFSTGGAAIKACGFGAWQVASFRSGIAGLTLLVLIPAARRLARPRVWLVGLAYAATLVLYVLANKLTTAANAIFLQSTAPLYVLLLSPWLLREPIRRRDILFMGFLATGMGLFFVGSEPATGIASDPPLGNLLAAATGFTWSLTLMGLRWLERTSDRERGLGAAASTAGNIIACVVTLPLALPVYQATASDWGLVIALGVFQIGCAYALLTSGMRHVPALEASLLLLLEPVLSPVFAWLVHGERVAGWALAGGLIILGATLTKAWIESRADSAILYRGKSLIE